MRARARAIFRGRVQGVYFRANCRARALEMGLTGWVENRPDGSVEAVFEGDEAAITEAIAWNRTSQPHAEVDEVAVTWSEPTGEFRSFDIRR